MKGKRARNVLIILLLFLIISAGPASITLLMDVSGAKLGFPNNMLQGTPFNNFLIPGLFLLIFFTLFPLLIIFGLFKRNDLRIADRFNLYKNQHWSWTFSYYIGLLLIIWINMELLFIKEFDFMHFIYSILGVVIIIITMLPITRNYYIIDSNMTTNIFNPTGQTT